MLASCRDKDNALVDLKHCQRRITGGNNQACRAQIASQDQQAQMMMEPFDLMFCDPGQFGCKSPEKSASNAGQYITRRNTQKHKAIGTLKNISFDSRTFLFVHLLIVPALFLLGFCKYVQTWMSKERGVTNDRLHKSSPILLKVTRITSWVSFSIRRVPTNWAFWSHFFLCETHNFRCRKRVQHSSRHSMLWWRLERSGRRFNWQSGRCGGRADPWAPGSTKHRPGAILQVVLVSETVRLLFGTGAHTHKQDQRHNDNNWFTYIWKGNSKQNTSDIFLDTEKNEPLNFSKKKKKRLNRLLKGEVLLSFADTRPAHFPLLSLIGDSRSQVFATVFVFSNVDDSDFTEMQQCAEEKKEVVNECFSGGPGAGPRGGARGAGGVDAAESEEESPGALGLLGGINARVFSNLSIICEPGLFSSAFGTLSPRIGARILAIQWRKSTDKNVWDSDIIWRL